MRTLSPVAVTTTSASSVWPLFNCRPPGVKRSISSVTIEAWPARIDLNRSPFGTRQRRWSQGW